MENRRKFIKKTAAVAALSFVADLSSAKPSGEKDKWGEILPQRQLIRNGEKVTSFCLGGYHLGVTANPKWAIQKFWRWI